MAKTSILTIMIRLAKEGNADKEVVRGLANLKKGVADVGIGFGVVAGAALGANAAFQKVYEIGRQGAELEATRSRFDRLAVSIGTTTDALMGDLRDATRGLYSDSQLMASAADLMSLGLAKNHKEAVRLSSVASALNMDMNQLVLTLGNMTTMRFDSLGVSVDGFNERLETLKKTGLSAGDAFKEAFLQQAEEQIERVGHAADTSMGAFLTYEASVNNLKDSFKSLLAEALVPILPHLTEMVDGIRNSNAIREEANRLIQGGIAHNREEALRLAQTSLEMQKLGRDTDIVNHVMREYGVSVETASDATAGIQMDLDEFDTRVRQLGEYIGGDLSNIWEDHQTKVAEIRKSYEGAKKATEIYKQKKQELTEAYYQELAAAGDDMEAREQAARTYEEQATALRNMYNDGTLAAQEMQKELDAETEAYNKRAAAIMFNIQQQAILAGVESGEVDPERAVAVLGQLAEGYGLIDERQKHAMMSSANLIQQWADGIITEEQLIKLLDANTRGMQDNASAAQNLGDEIEHTGKRAEDSRAGFMEMKEAQAELASGINSEAGPAVAGLKKDINGLPPNGSNWNYHFTITQTGRVPRLPSVVSGATQGTGAWQALQWLQQQQNPEGAATGGPLTAPITAVGEDGFEYIVRNRDGGFTVLPHDVSAWLLHAGIVPDRGMRFGGDLETHITAGQWFPIRSSGGGSKPPKKPPKKKGGGGSSTVAIAPPEQAPAAAEVVAPLAAATEEAVQSAAAAQQQQITEGIQTRNTISAGNAEITAQLQELNEQIRNLNSVLPRSIAAAFQQMMP